MFSGNCVAETKFCTIPGPRPPDTVKAPKFATTTCTGAGALVSPL